MLIAGAVSAIATAVLFALRRRRFGSPEEARRFQHALASGRVPAEVNLGHWRRVIEDSIRLSRTARVAIAALGVLIVALGTTSAVLLPPQRLYALLLTATLLVATTSAGLFTHRNLQRARQLHRTLP